MIGGDTYRRVMDKVMAGLMLAAAIIVILFLFVILGYIVYRGAAGIDLALLTQEPKPAGEVGGGLVNALWGTIIMVSAGALLSLPVGIGAGVYLAEYGTNWFGNSIRFITDVLTGVPSIVVGVFAYAVIVVPMGTFSAWAGAFALAVIMAPIITRTTEEIIRLVPQSYREAALALGAPPWRVTVGVVLRAAAGGIATGLMLAIARAAGETAPLLFTALGYRYLTTDLGRPMSSLTVDIYKYATSPYDDWHRQAWGAALILITIVLVINVLVKFLTRSRYSEGR